MDEKLIKYILNVFIFVLLIFALIVFINTMGINLNAEEPPKKLLQVITMEGFEPSISTDGPPISTGAAAFCESYRGSSAELDTACSRLTNTNCNETSCCVFTNNKCVAGSAKGPTYNTDSNGNTSTAEYYFRNQCYGANCPA
jgi:hypothetical protein